MRYEGGDWFLEGTPQPSKDPLLQRDGVRRRLRVYLDGPAGTGKSHLIARAAKRTHRKGKRTLVTCGKMLVIKHLKQEVHALANVDVVGLGDHMLDLADDTWQQILRPSGERVDSFAATKVWIPELVHVDVRSAAKGETAALSEAMRELLNEFPAENIAVNSPFAEQRSLMRRLLARTDKSRSEC